MSTSKDLIDVTLKIAVLGETGCGKTQFVNRYCEGKYSEKHELTIGVDYKKPKDFDIPDTENTATCLFSDCSGNRAVTNVVRGFANTSDSIFLCYALDNPKALDNLKYWLDAINKNECNHAKSIYIIGMKSDIAPHDINAEKIKEFIGKHSTNTIARHVITSAKTGKNLLLISDIINQEAKKKLQRRQQEKQTPPSSAAIPKPTQPVTAYLVSSVISCSFGPGLLAVGIAFAVLIVPSWPIAIAGAGTTLATVGIFCGIKAYKNYKHNLQRQDDDASNALVTG